MPAKKHGTKGMRLWEVKLVDSYLSSTHSLFILTRIRSIQIAAERAQVTIKRDHPGRTIESIKYQGTIDN